MGVGFVCKYNVISLHVSQPNAFTNNLNDRVWTGRYTNGATGAYFRA